MSDMTQIECRFQRLDHGTGIELPRYESDQAAGMDIRAAVEQTMELKPGERALIPTGFKMALPDGYEAQIRPRSGLAYKNGITMLNSPGTIDSDYRGEVKVLAINHGIEPFMINHGDRIAQMIISPVHQATIREVESLEETERSDGGFGSTGVK